MKKMQTLLLALSLALCPLTFTGCKLFQNTPVETVKYYTFLDSWTLSKAAYDAWCERVVQGKISKADEASVDVAWNKYRTAFLSSLTVARQNWSAPTPANLAVIQRELLKLITTLTPK